jgi:CubicO group peptidase (beta-lactamase class C family)
MTDLDVVWASLDERVESGWAPGIVGGVFADGMAQVYATGVLAFDSDDAMTPETRFRIASLGKPIAGVLGAMLVGDGVLALDEPVSTWMPELANPRVLRHPTAALDDTVDAVRPITVRHLLTATNGLGFSFDDTTVGPALQEFATGPFPPPFTPDEYLARIAAIPLAWQPGERWSYHTSADLLSVLLSRASGLPLHDLLRQRILAPLGMRSTGFSASGETLPIEYRGTENGIEVFEEYTTAFDHPPLFESLGGGLVSTVPDYLAFLCAVRGRVAAARAAARAHDRPAHRRAALDRGHDARPRCLLGLAGVRRRDRPLRLGRRRGHERLRRSVPRARRRGDVAALRLRAPGRVGVLLGPPDRVAPAAPYWCA